MNQSEVAVALARMYQSGWAKGYDVDFSMVLAEGLGIESAATPTNDGDHGLCDYDPTKQQVIDLGDNKKVIIAETTTGKTHVFYGEVWDDGKADFLDPLIFLSSLDHN